MTTPSSAVGESPLDSPAIAAATLSATRPLYWSVRRELWENRSIYVGPLAAAAVFLLGFSISLVFLPRHMRNLSALNAAQQRTMLVAPYDVAAILIIITTFVVGAFYCIEALHSERRDRSILFWKSLPVSDLTTVLSKAIIPLVVLPLLAFVIVVPMQLVMVLQSTAVLLASGLSPAPLWRQLSLLQGWLILAYGLVVHALWYAPLYGWLLLVSAWARRTAILWALLPFLVIGVVEKVAFGSIHFVSLLCYRLRGGFKEAFTVEAQRSGVIDRLADLDPGRFLGAPGLWIGLVFAAAFLAAATRLRRHRGPI
jgi:ABC-2 type transport system permease protein